MTSLFMPSFLPVIPTTSLGIIKRLNLTANLELCLDSGDASSYDGTSQTWLDVSGKNFHFYRGPAVSASSADPTFNGVAGRQSVNDYFSFDGGDYFRLNQANPTWVNNISKNNAVFTLAQWIYLHNIGSTSTLWGHMGNPVAGGYGVIGFAFGFSSSSLRRINFSVYKNDAAFAYSRNSSAACNNNAWNFVAVSVNENAGTVRYQVNGATENYTSQSYSSPSSSNATSVFEIGSVGAGENPVAAGQRIRTVMGWSRALTAIELAALYEGTKRTYGH